MGHESSVDDDAAETYTFGNPSSLNFLEYRKSSGDSNIYRSAKSLHKDLGKPLMRMKHQDLDAEELSCFRVRLEQSEHEITRMLQAMQCTEDALRGSFEEQEIGEGIFTITSLREQSGVNLSDDEHVENDVLDKEITEENESVHDFNIS
ncbi:hypothetical protein Smp_190330 [Schistosoma mansoni]|uniref:hypothetical protein n=1 Tax=Schistosoma mansoni TaxID=6183 RepID=UPI00019B3856|nr:hypothetical protein Smp_190330 [Schistosoma mansoni]|eukprot:XP_018647076.1 hypothetical protein Smp_190330 [Schistosoma mansoni]